jgi:hypothetical protein
MQPIFLISGGKKMGVVSSDNVALYIALSMREHLFEANGIQHRTSFFHK